MRYKSRKIGLKVVLRFAAPVESSRAAPTSVGKSAMRPAAQPTPRVTSATHAGGFCRHRNIKQTRFLVVI